MKTTNQIDREANERKAREIANDNCTHICLADCSAESYFSSENDCYKAALQAMKWKDKESKELVFETELLGKFTVVAFDFYDAVEHEMSRFDFGQNGITHSHTIGISKERAVTVRLQEGAHAIAA